jgi:hypothetical protein
MAERTKALPVQVVPILNQVGLPGTQILDYSGQRIALMIRSLGLDPVYLGFDPQAAADATRTQVFRLDPGDVWSPDHAFGTHQGQVWGWGGYGAVEREPSCLVEVQQVVIDPTAPNPEQSGLELPAESTAAPPEPPTPWAPAPPPRARWHDLGRRL